jgi:hypothetical protein
MNYLKKGSDNTSAHNNHKNESYLISDASEEYLD